MHFDEGVLPEFLQLPALGPKQVVITHDNQPIEEIRAMAAYAKS